MAIERPGAFFFIKKERALFLLNFFYAVLIWGKTVCDFSKIETGRYFRFSFVRGQKVLDQKRVDDSFVHYSEALLSHDGLLRFTSKKNFNTPKTPEENLAFLKALLWHLSPEGAKSSPWDDLTLYALSRKVGKIDFEKGITPAQGEFIVDSWVKALTPTKDSWIDNIKELFRIYSFPQQAEELGFDQVERIVLKKGLMDAFDSMSLFRNPALRDSFKASTRITQKLLVRTVDVLGHTVNALSVLSGGPPLYSPRSGFVNLFYKSKIESMARSILSEGIEKSKPELLELLGTAAKVDQAIKLFSVGYNTTIFPLGVYYMYEEMESKARERGTRFMGEQVAPAMKIALRTVSEEDQKQADQYIFRMLQSHNGELPMEDNTPENAALTKQLRTELSRILKQDIKENADLKTLLLDFQKRYQDNPPVPGS
jgi:hypothetical protein